MHLENTLLNGLKVIHLKKLDDQRGAFVKVFNKDFFVENDLETEFEESYFSVSSKNVIRGMHFQIPPASHTKLVFVNRGSILDVVLDLRKSSTTYGCFYKRLINTIEPVLMYIPVGFAHGFLALEDQTIVSYLQSSVYKQDYDEGIRWDSFGMKWGIEGSIISERDKSFKPLSNFKSPF